MPAAIGMLERLPDPVARAIANASIDDKPLTAADEKALGEAREWSKHNKGTPHEEFLAELGITQEEIDNLSRTEVKRIVWTDPAKSDVRSLSKPVAMQIFSALLRFDTIGRG